MTSAAEKIRKRYSARNPTVFCPGFLAHYYDSSFSSVFVLFDPDQRLHVPFPLTLRRGMKARATMCELTELCELSLLCAGMPIPCDRDALRPCH